MRVSDKQFSILSATQADSLTTWRAADEIVKRASPSRRLTQPWDARGDDVLPIMIASMPERASSHKEYSKVVKVALIGRSGYPVAASIFKLTRLGFVVWVRFSRDTFFGDVRTDFLPLLDTRPSSTSLGRTSSRKTPP